MKYSIFRKTISMKMVCGQAHPHHILPKITVNKMMNTTNVIMASTKRKKSCGQNAMPKTMNFRSIILKSITGCPFTLMKGQANKRANRIQPTRVRARYNFPIGFLGYIQARFPSLLMVEMRSRNDSSCRTSLFIYDFIFFCADESVLAITGIDLAVVSMADSMYKSPCGSLAPGGLVPCKVSIKLATFWICFG